MEEASHFAGDRNTFHAAGEKVVSVLEASNIPYSCYIYPQEDLEPMSWLLVRLQ